MKKALVVWGGWAGHEPQQVAEILAEELGGNDFAVEISDTLEAFGDREKLKGLDLIVLEWTMGQIKPEQLKPLLGAVRSGTGFAGVHGGAGDSFRNETEYQFMVGGQWVAHPGGIVRYTVEITDRDDPVTAGLVDFEMESEQYYMHVDPSNHVLGVTTFGGAHGGVDWIKGCRMPVAWKRRYGLGRVFYSSLGHVAKDFQVAEARTIIRRGMIWAAR